MSTAEQTATDLVQAQVRDASPLQRIALVMPWVSPSSRKELQRAHDDVSALITANRHLAIQLANARKEIECLRGAPPCRRS